METGANAVKKFIGYIAAGLAVYIPVICIVYLIASRFRAAVFFGALYGSAVTLLYYYLFARAIKNAADSNPDEVKKRIQAAYSLRMFLLVILEGAGFIVSLTLKLIDWLPMLLALLVPRLSILIYQLQEKKHSKGDSAE